MRSIRIRFQDRNQERLQEVITTPDALIVPRIGEQVHLVNQRYTVTKVLHDYYQGYFGGVDITLEEL